MSFLSKLFGGGKTDFGSGQYNAEMMKAAGQTSAVAGKAESFADTFFQQYMQPAVDSLERSTAFNEERMGRVFDMQYGNAQAANERYQTRGIPAEDRYYKMVDDYSSADEEEEQARLAIGDLRAAQATQDQVRTRALAARGIDPTSGAAIAAQTNSNLMATVAQAAAANRARDNAKRLGMQLTEGAAQFGRAGLDNVASFSAGARDAAVTGQSLRTNQISGLGNAASVPLQGYSTALQGYGNNLSTFANMTGRTKALEVDNEQKNAAGFGKLLGTAAGIGLSFVNPAAGAAMLTGSLK